MSWSLLGPALLCGTILVVEFWREKPRGAIDFLTAVNAVYLVCFAIVPPYLYWLVEAGRVPPRWQGLLFIDLNSNLFFFAGLLAWLSYLFLIRGYFSGSARPAVAQPIPQRRLRTWGAVTLLLGALSIFVYAVQIGGVRFLLETIMVFRAQGEPIYTEFAFLKTLSVVATGSTVLFLGAMLETHEKKGSIICLLAISVAVSLLALVANAGRLAVIQYLLLFPLYFVVRDRRVSATLLFFCATVFLAMSVFGHGLFDLFNGTARLQQQLMSFVADPIDIVTSLVLEFAFPWVNVAVALQAAGTDLSLRWFADIPLAVAYLLPKRLLNLELPPTVSMEAAELIRQPFPADLLSFGIYSMYVPGAFIAAWGFGRLVRVLEVFIPSSGSPAWLVLRAAWLAYIGSRVMYGNPHHTLFTALPLLIASSALLLPPFGKAATPIMRRESAA